VRAPELRGRRWLNTGGAELSLADLRGKIVLLDFWTFCCVNCLHVLDELRELEERYADVLVTIGVHSPKFAHEADPDAVVAAVERYAVHHPRRPGVADVGRVRGAGVADARGDRPAGLRGRADVG
jgi:thiol-disulfide isomerase/thioredoxin